MVNLRRVALTPPSLKYFCCTIEESFTAHESNRKAMNRNWSNQKANPALKTKTGNK